MSPQDRVCAAINEEEKRLEDREPAQQAIRDRDKGNEARRNRRLWTPPEESMCLHLRKMPLNTLGETEHGFLNHLGGKSRCSHEFGRVLDVLTKRLKGEGVGDTRGGPAVGPTVNATAAGPCKSVLEPDHMGERADGSQNLQGPLLTTATQPILTSEVTARSQASPLTLLGEGAPTPARSCWEVLWGGSGSWWLGRGCWLGYGCAGMWLCWDVAGAGTWLERGWCRDVAGGWDVADARTWLVLDVADAGIWLMVGC